MARQDRFRRKRPMREPLETATYAVEGRNTEPEYLEALARDRGLGKRFKLIPSYSDPCQIVNDLWKQKKKLEKQGIRRDHWIAVFDREFSKERKDSIARARQLAKRRGIKCIESSPSFEYWLRLHYSRDDRPYGSQKDVESDLKTYIPSYNKRKGALANVMDQLMGAVEVACGNARWLNSHGEYGNSTEMPELMEIMDSMEEK